MTDDEARREAHEIRDAIVRRQSSLSQLLAREQALEQARYLLGTGKIFEPQKRNDGVPRFLFCDEEWDDKNDCGYPWCAAFVVFCFAHTTSPIPGDQRSLWACANILKRARSRNCLLPGGCLPEPGDIMLLFGRRGSDPLNDDGVHHCGIVESVDDGEITTIEGNLGNVLIRYPRAADPTTRRAADRPRRVGDPMIAGYARF